MVPSKLRPVFPAVDRNPKPELGSEKEEIRFNKIFLDYVSVSTNAFRILRGYERRPCFTVISSFENVRCHVAKGMPIECRISSTGVEVAGLDPVHP